MLKKTKTIQVSKCILVCPFINHAHMYTTLPVPRFLLFHSPVHKFIVCNIFQHSMMTDTTTFTSSTYIAYTQDFNDNFIHSDPPTSSACRAALQPLSMTIVVNEVLPQSINLCLFVLAMQFVKVK